MADNTAIIEPTGYLDWLFSNTASRIVVAFIIMLLGFILGKFLGKVITKSLREIEANKLVRNATGIKVDIETILGSLASYITYSLTLLATLDQVGLKNIVLYMLVAAILAILIITFILSVKDLIPNLVSGIYILRKKKIKENDKIRLDNIEGKVVHIGLIQMQLITDKNDMIYVPNSTVVKSKIEIKPK
ncbi:mechanosensitive ion channel [Candidatus Woesearchaeota archaeon]|nr:mechanosensitive ion channel [Candidatus Woesearchaeota archaeon]